MGTFCEGIVGKGNLGAGQAEPLEQWQVINYMDNPM